MRLNIVLLCTVLIAGSAAALETTTENNAPTPATPTVPNNGIQNKTPDQTVQGRNPAVTENPGINNSVNTNKNATNTKSETENPTQGRSPVTNTGPSTPNNGTTSTPNNGTPGDTKTQGRNPVDSTNR